MGKSVPSLPSLSKTSHHRPGVFVARNTFCHLRPDHLDMVGGNIKFYKQITDNADFADDFLTWMFERYRRAKGA
jgi:hypothetical protein